MKAHRHAKVTSEMVVVDKRTKKELHRDARMRERKLHAQGAEHFGVVKVQNGITLSMGFQGVRLDVGVEMPWPCRPGLEAAKDLVSGFDLAYQFIDDELAKRAPEMEGLLKDINRKYGH